VSGCGQCGQIHNGDGQTGRSLANKQYQKYIQNLVTNNSDKFVLGWEISFHNENEKHMFMV